MSKRNLIVSINGLEMIDKLTEDEAAIMLNSIHEGFVGSMGELQKKFGFTESYTKEKIGDGIWKYTFVVNGEHKYYIYTAGTDSIPVLPQHKYYAEIEVKEINKKMKCIFCDTKEALDTYKELTEKSVAEYEGYGDFNEHFNMTYSA